MASQAPSGLINAAAWFALAFVLTVLIKLAIDQVRPGVYFALGLISEYSCITAGFLLTRPRGCTFCE